MTQIDEKEMFVLHRGALFKKSSKGYHPSPHCPCCKRAMFFQTEHTRFYCFSCGTPSEITIDILDSVLAEVIRKDKKENDLVQVAPNQA